MVYVERDVHHDVVHAQPRHVLVPGQGVSVEEGRDVGAVYQVVVGNVLHDTLLGCGVSPGETLPENLKHEVFWAPFCCKSSKFLIL